MATDTKSARAALPRSPQRRFPLAEYPSALTSLTSVYGIETSDARRQSAPVIPPVLCSRFTSPRPRTHASHRSVPTLSPRSPVAGVFGDGSPDLLLLVPILSAKGVSQAVRYMYAKEPPHALVRWPCKGCGPSLGCISMRSIQHSAAALGSSHPLVTTKPVVWSLQPRCCVGVPVHTPQT